MAGSVNKVIILGNLGHNPEVRTSQDGGKIVSFSVATTESWKDKVSGEKKDKTEWHRVVVFNRTLAEVCEKYLRKGSKVYLEGQLQTRKWTDKNGSEKQTTEILVMPFGGEIVLCDKSDSGYEVPPQIERDDIPF